VTERESTHIDTAFMGLTSSDGVAVGCKLPARRDPAQPFFRHVGQIDLAELPDELSRQLFEALRLEIRYNPSTQVATCRITLIGLTIDVVARTTQASNVIPFPRRPATSDGPTHQVIEATSDDYEQAINITARSGSCAQTPLLMVCVVPPTGFEPATLPF
jgi:hypothetical protein